MTAVTRFEADLLRLTRALLTGAPEKARGIVHQRVTAPAGLTRNAVLLLEETLRKGIIHVLACSGWRRDAFLRDGAPLAGHPWQRIPLEERTLAFTEIVPAFLLWLTAERPSEARGAWVAPSVQPSIADFLFFFLAAEVLSQFSEQWTVIHASTPFAANPYFALAEPDDTSTNDFAMIATPQGTAILECLQSRLASLWIERDKRKAGMTDWQRLRTQGENEERVLNGFLQTLEAANRRDLARFLLVAVSRRSSTDLTHWIGGLPKTSLKLQERLETKRAALALVKQSETFDRWDREARRVNYFDEHYAASQFWKAEYRTHDGPRLLAEYRSLVRQLDPLAQGAP